jgi:hypothetical protein
MRTNIVVHDVRFPVNYISCQSMLLFATMLLFTEPTETTEAQAENSRIGGERGGTEVGEEGGTSG